MKIAILLFAVFNIFGGDNQLVTLPVDVDDLNVGFRFKEFAQFGDVDIHAAGVEIGVLFPYLFQCMIAFQDIVCMGTKQ